MKKIFAKSCLAIVLAVTVASQAFAGINLPSISPLVKQVGPAVVNISTERMVKSQFGGFRGMPREFEEFFEQFGPFLGPQGNGKEQLQSALGTGFIISKDGYIVTNNHVVQNADKIYINFSDKKTKTAKVEAKVIGLDPETDLALLKINVKNDLPTVKFGDSDSMEVGDWVVAIGNPFGLSNTVTTGIVSAKGRDIHAGPYDNFIQTDASINPGNSGGPLLNLDGEVIGINTAIAASGQGIGFAIPSKLASNIIEQLKNGKKVSRGWIGVTIQDIDEITAKALGLKGDGGALIGSVLPNEPAAKAGLKAGDIIIRVDNSIIKSASDLTRAVASYKPNSKVNMLVVRDGKELNLTVTLGERNLSQNGKQTAIEKGTSLGLSLRDLNIEDRQQLRLPQDLNGIIVTNVKESGQAAKAGILPGDVIMAANLKSIKNVHDLINIMDKEGKQRGAIVLQIYRQGNAFIITVPLEK